jgi:flagellin
VGVTGVSGAAASAFGANESSAITFPGLSAGEGFTLNGLTFTSAGTTSNTELATAFSNLKSGMTALAVSAASTTTTLSRGSFSGTFAEGFTTGASNGAVVTATATSKGNVGDIVSGNSVPSVEIVAGASGTRAEVSTITFQPLNPNEFVTVNGLTFTARVNMTKAEVAAAFSNISSNTASSAVTLANPVAANFGKFTGTFATGFSTGAATTAGVVVATSTTQEDVTNIAFKGVKAVASATVTTAGSTVAASTVYGSVTLNSQNTFTIKPGAKAYATPSASAADPTYANFTALGFEAKTINPKGIGRLNFQVGPAANQLISIDLADFGKNGDITGPITSDRAPTNLLTVNSANDVIMNVNKSLDRIAATRATMGAVMNRLEHVIDNLTNVVMNSEASRSQIEDADYAQASTELARTQIMQQAATAVLAQANTSQQTVLKLLQG